MSKSREPKSIPVTDFGRSGSIPTRKAAEIASCAQKLACVLTYASSLSDEEFSLFRRFLPQVPGDIDGIRVLTRAFASIRETRAKITNVNCLSELCPTLQQVRNERLRILQERQGAQSTNGKNGRHRNGSLI